MYAVHINEHTQKWIGRKFNEGVVPELEGDSYFTRAYYLVKDDGPNEIVSVHDFNRGIRWECTKVLTRPRRNH